MTSKKQKSGKREDYISWEDYFMGLASLSALQSEDPEIQVGACIVNSRNRIVSTGYKSMPTGCGKFPWTARKKGETGKRLETKEMYVCHAVANAILNRNMGPLNECSIYVTLFPCNKCAQMIIQSGIREVVYKSGEVSEAIRKMFGAGQVTYRKCAPKVIDIDFTRF